MNSGKTKKGRANLKCNRTLDTLAKIKAGKILSIEIQHSLFDERVKRI